MAKIKRHFNFMILAILVILSVFCIIEVAYAQTNPDYVVTIPEPSSVAIIMTGMIGWIVRFARKRFSEFKRLFDIAVASCGLVFAFPIIALTGILIKIVSPGPVFFRQERLGLNGKAFSIIKMRTMKLDAEKETGAVWARENDPRLIKFGKLWSVFVQRKAGCYDRLAAPCPLLGHGGAQPGFLPRFLPDQKGFPG